MPRAPQSSALLAGSPRANRSVFSISMSRTRSMPFQERHLDAIDLAQREAAAAVRMPGERVGDVVSRGDAASGASRSSAAAMRSKASSRAGSGSSRCPAATRLLRPSLRTRLAMRCELPRSRVTQALPSRCAGLQDRRAMGTDAAGRSRGKVSIAIERLAAIVRADFVGQH